MQLFLFKAKLKPNAENGKNGKKTLKTLKTHLNFKPLGLNKSNCNNKIRLKGAPIFVTVYVWCRNLP